MEEGGTYSLTVQDLVDPGEDTATQVVIDWGDTTADTQIDPATLPQTVTHEYDDGQPTTTTITAQIIDEDGTHLAASKTVTVANIAPTGTVTDGGTVDEGSSGFVEVTLARILPPPTRLPVPL